MEQYIDKNALLLRIKKLKMDIGNIFNEYDEGFWEGRASAFDDVICALDTLEVKKVNLDREIYSIWNQLFNFNWNDKSLLSINHRGFASTAKYFFELGLEAQKGE